MRKIAIIWALCLSMAAPVAEAQGFFAPADSARINAATARAIKEPIDDLIQDVEHLHPVAMFYLAKRLCDSGRCDEAVFWYYEGELRWRAHLMQNHDDFEGGEFSVLEADIGPDIKIYATADMPSVLEMFDRVLEWDANHPDEFTPDGKAKDDARQWIRNVAAYGAAHQDEIKKHHDDAVRQANALKSPDDPYSGQGGMPMGMPAAMVTAYDRENFAAFQVGVTEKSAVVQSLGKPEWWSTDKDGSTTIGYSYNKSSRELSVIGMTQRVIVSFNFDKNRILTAINLPKN